MALPTFPSVEGASLTTLGSANLVINKPAGTVQGNLLICYIICSANTTITAPAGWDTDVSAAGIRAFSKIAGSSEPSSYTFTRAATTNSILGVMVRCANTHATSPKDVFGSATGGSGTTVTLPALTVTSGITLLQIAEVIANTSFTPPSGPTELFDQTFPTQNYTGAVGSEAVAPGSTGTRVWTAGVSGVRAGVMYALRGTDETAAPSGIASTAAIGAPSVAPTTSPTGIAATSTLGAPSLSTPVSPVGIAPTSALGTPTLSSSVSPNGVASTASVGSPAADQGVEVASVAPTSVLGTPEITETVIVTGIAPTSALGSPEVAVTAAPDGIAPTSALGSPEVAVTAAPDGIAPTSVLGSPSISPDTTPDGIASTAVFGVARIDASMSVTGIAPGSAIGTPGVYQPVDTPERMRAEIKANTAKGSITNRRHKATITSTRTRGEIADT